jgi:hypothetical protein
MTVNIAAGTVAVPTQNSTGTSLCASDGVEQVTLPAAPASGSNRYDLIICRPRGTDLDGGVNNDFIFDSVQGTAAASATVPATPAGTVALAQVYLPGGSAAITPANITDVRPGGMTAGVPASNPRGYVASAVGPASTVSAGASATTVMSLTATVTAGRRYRLSLFVFGAQQSATGTCWFNLANVTNIDSAQGRFAQATGLIAGSFLAGQGVFLYSPSSSGSQTWTVQAQTNAGTLSVSANNCQMLLEDIGSQ